MYKKIYFILFTYPCLNPEVANLIRRYMCYRYLSVNSYWTGYMQMQWTDILPSQKYLTL